MGWTHAVDYDLLRSACGRHNDTSGTHAKAIDAASFDLSYEIVLGSRQVASASLAAVILYAVDECGGMLEPYANSYAFCFEMYALRVEVAARMTGPMKALP